MQLSDIKLEHWPTSRLIPYARNPRKNDHAVEQMASAISEFGFRIPIIAKSTGEICDGQEFTGKAAVREADGATFDSLCHEEVPA